MISRARSTLIVGIRSAMRWSVHLPLGLWFLVTFGLATVRVAAISLPLVWHWSNPAPHGNNIVGMGYTNGLYIQVTDRGQIYTSEDLSLWTPRQSQTLKALRAVTYFGNRVIVTGESGTVLWADLLDDFHSVDLGTSDWLEGVAASRGAIVAVGDNGAVFSSGDGQSWQRQPVTFTNWLHGVASRQGVFVAVGDRGLIATSYTGTGWQKRVSGTLQNLNKVFWLRDRFVAVGESGAVFGSFAGTTWFSMGPTGATNSLYTAAASPDAMTIAGQDELRLSKNSIWSNELDPSRPSHAPIAAYYSSLWDGTNFVMGGDTGLIVLGIPSNGSYDWSTPFESVRTWLWDINRAPGFYVTVGDAGTIMTSANGLDWTLELIPDVVTNAVLLGIGGTTNGLVAVGSGGTLLFSPNSYTNVVETNTTVFNGATNIVVTTNRVSTIGIQWKLVSLPTTNDLQGVGVLGNLLVVAGDFGTIFTSIDYTNWTAQPTGVNSFISSVTAFPGGLTAVGDLGLIMTSPDGRAWTKQTSGTSDWVYRVRYLGNQLIATGENGLILTSTNGVAWTAQNSGTTEWLNDATLIGDAFVVVGTQGTVLISTDTTHWTNVGTISEKSLYGVAVNDGQLVTVGFQGVILRSQVIPQLDPITIVRYGRSHTGEAGNANLFLFAGKPDQRFTLDSRIDLGLSPWGIGPQLEFRDSSGTLFYYSTDTNSFPEGFFRATVRP